MVRIRNSLSAAAHEDHGCDCLMPSLIAMAMHFVAYLALATVLYLQGQAFHAAMLGCHAIACFVGTHRCMGDSCVSSLSPQILAVQTP